MGAPRSLEQRKGGEGGGRGGLGSRHCALRPVHNDIFYNFFTEKSYVLFELPKGVL